MARADNLQPTIRSILINRKNVFETGSRTDNVFPYSWANKIHIVTKEDTIRHALLFKEGDALDAEKISESERLLRRQGNFRYVKITPLENMNGQVDVKVETEDVWTTALELSFGLAAGKRSYSFGINEQNFLGRGKEIGAFVSKNIDRTTRGAVYRDPQILGTRWEFFGGYGKDEKGKEWETDLTRPFYSALVTHSEGVLLGDRQNEDRLFDDGDEVATFDHHSRNARVFGAVALVASMKRVRRVSLAYENNLDEFSNAKGPQSPALPEERRVNPILLGYQHENIRFHKVRGVTTFDRDEDINLGGSFIAEAGPTNEHTGATQRGWFGRARITKNFHFQENQVWFNSIEVDGRQEHDDVQNGVLRLQTQYYLLDWLPLHTASLRSEYVVSKNLDPEREFLLGGENGLRGYSVRQFSATDRILFTLEDRRGLLYDWLHLISIGWAWFMDSGAVWEKGSFPDANQFRTDVGGGIRFAPSRSTNPGLIRIDVAYALQDNNRSSRFVLNIGADLSFGDRPARKFDR